MHLYPHTFSYICAYVLCVRLLFCTAVTFTAPSLASEYAVGSSVSVTWTSTGYTATPLTLQLMEDVPFLADNLLATWTQYANGNSITLGDGSMSFTAVDSYRKSNDVYIKVTGDGVTTTEGARFKIVTSTYMLTNCVLCVVVCM